MPWLRRRMTTSTRILTPASPTARPRRSLLTLEGIIGEDTMGQAMHAYFMKYRFTHPAKEDFLKTVEEVSGKDLRWYFNQAVYGSQVLDYEILNVNSFPANWYESDKGKKNAKAEKGKDNTLYQSYVTLHRKEDFTHSDLSRDQVRQRRNHPRALGWTRPMDSLWIFKEGSGRLRGD